MVAKPRAKVAVAGVALAAAFYAFCAHWTSADGPTSGSPSSISTSTHRADPRASPGPLDSPIAGADPREGEARLDGVAAGIPMLAGRSPQEQLQTLRWMQHVPGFKVVSLFPDLRNDGRMSHYERESIARSRLAAETHKLERSGVSAPDVGMDFQAAKFDDTLSPEEASALLANSRM